MNETDKALAALLNAFHEAGIELGPAAFDLLVRHKWIGGVSDLLIGLAFAAVIPWLSFRASKFIVKARSLYENRKSSSSDGEGHFFIGIMLGVAAAISAIIAVTVGLSALPVLLVPEGATIKSLLP